MKKRLCILLAISMLLLWGCIPSKTYTVRFYNGSDTTANVDVTMRSGEKLAVPESLCEGRTVNGLYRDAALSDAYGSDTVVTGNMVVFIDWNYEIPADPTETAAQQEPFTPHIRGSWGFDQAMEQDGQNLLWFLEIEVPKDGEISVYNGDVLVGKPVINDTGAGKYMVYVPMEQNADGTLRLKGEIQVGVADYYVIGTCGNGGWQADAVETNSQYRMSYEGGAYVLNVTFTPEEATQDGKVAFQIAYGCCGIAAQKHCYADDNGESFLVVPGAHTISFDPTTGSISLG